MLAVAHMQNPKSRRLKAQKAVPRHSGFSLVPFSTVVSLGAHLGRGGDVLEVCLVSYPKGCKSSRWSGWQWKVKLSELVTHVLQEGQVEPLCVMVKLRTIFINLTVCWLAGRWKPLFLPYAPTIPHGRGRAACRRGWGEDPCPVLTCS